VLVEAVEESDIITFEREVFNELHGIKVIILTYLFNKTF
jgi:hypothetical protein